MNADAKKSGMKPWTRTAARDAVITTIAVFAISCLTGYVVYVSAAEGLKKEVQSNLLSIAKTASNLVDGDAHQQITDPEQKGSELYEATRAPFYKLLKANENIAFIYTVIPKDDKIFFVLDSKIIKPGEEDDTSGVMEEYTDATDMMKQAMQEKSSLVEEEAYTDNWGTFLSGYAPIYDSKGAYIGTVGADIRLTDYLARLHNIEIALYIGLVIGGVAAIISGICVFFVRRKALEMEHKHHMQQEEMLMLQQSSTEEQLRAKEDSEKQRRGHMEEFARSFELSVQKVVSQVANSASEMQSGAESVTRIAADTKQRSNIVANASNEAAQTSSQVAFAAEQLSASIHEISEQTRKSSEIASNASHKAESAKATIQSLAEKSMKVNEIISVITEIAEQINLLALNATIESARAGEAGKGFAVVANEVKNLAMQVAKATDEITRQIQAMQSATNISVASVMDIITIIDDVSKSTGAVADAVQRQSSMTTEIASNIARTSTGTKDISNNIASVQEGAEKTGETAEHVLASAQSLNQQSTVLREKVDEFLRSIRAA